MASNSIPPHKTAGFHATVDHVDIWFIGAAAFDLDQCQKGSIVSAIYICDGDNPTDAKVHLASAKPATESGDNIPSKYHNFLNVISAEASNCLPEHRPYNLKIELEDGAELPTGPIYSLSKIEQMALCEYIPENLAKGYICPSSTPGGAPVLFMKKSDGSLHLCVNYCKFNKLTQKDKYPLPLILGILDRLRTAKIFTKLDL